MLTLNDIVPNTCSMGVRFTAGVLEEREMKVQTQSLSKSDLIQISGGVSEDGTGLRGSSTFVGEQGTGYAGSPPSEKKHSE